MCSKRGPRHKEMGRGLRERAERPVKAKSWATMAKGPRV